ncbi:MAG: hypothetical protein K2G63_01705 [Oscillospiraceae bacterium]|nr:hypothetical protein [Oscillospiraceae bacterium]
MINNTDDILIFFVSCAFHELGHLIAMFISGAESREVYISGLGIKIVQSRNNMISVWRTLIILLSGSLFNFLIFLLGYKILSPEILTVNLILCIFNMLPFRNLDGGSILICIGEILNADYIFEIILKVFSVIILIAVLILIYIYGFEIIPAGAVILYYCISEFFD